MAKAIDPKFANLLDDFQCGICLGEVNDVQQCPHCSKIFCKMCIQQWLNKSRNCPNCRAPVDKNSMVKGCMITQIMGSIKQAVADLDISSKDHCSKHEKQQLSMFCYICKDSICTECFFSKEHAEHKESIVPLGEAFKACQQKLKTTISGINDRVAKTKVALTKLQIEERLIKNNLDSIDKLQKESEALVSAGEASPAAMMEIMRIERSITELPDESEFIRQCVLNPSSNVLLVRITGSQAVERNKPPFEINLQSSCGFEWKITIDNEDSLNGNIVWDANVCMVRGKPGLYSVCFGTEPEESVKFKLNENNLVGYVMEGTDESKILQISVIARGIRSVQKKKIVKK